jgi:DNA-directed RNA polymerase specialized sigma24 family protein
MNKAKNYMKSEGENVGEVLLKYGPVVGRILHRQFPSLPSDVIDDLVVESIARIWKRFQPIAPSPTSDRSLFPLIFTVARRLAIDHLRYSPRIIFASPDLIDQPSRETISESGESSGMPIVDAQLAMAELSPLDRRILKAAMAPPLSGDWARELALELVHEESRKSGHNNKPDVDPQTLTKLGGKLRVRKIRAIEKLRKTMRNKGYKIP